jgi:hypothetical protein
MVVWALRGERADGDTTPIFWGLGVEGSPEGWGSNFTTEVKESFGSIPTGSRWVCGDCGSGDPTSLDHICR